MKQKYLCHQAFLGFFLFLAHVFLCPILPVNGQTLFINELMASNKSALADGDGEYSDWIELYNDTEQKVSLEGFGLTDNSGNPHKWVFPKVEINPKGFLLIWASGKNKASSGEIHTNFSISAEGETITLSDKNGEKIDRVEGVHIPTDLSYGRIVDGESALSYFSKPSPGRSNATSVPTLGMTPPILPTVTPGFYSTDQRISFSTNDPQTKIYYTLDGSKPTAHSTLFEEPFLVSDRSLEENHFSMIPTTHHGGARGYSEPLGEVSKGTTVRTLTVKDGHEAIAQSFTYFIFPEGRSKYALPVISLVTDEENLFSEESGLLVPGVNYDSLHATPHLTGNYFQRGMEWERPAHLSYFEKDGSLGFQDDIGLRIHGGFSRSFPQKSLRVYFRSIYGNNSADYKIFEEREYTQIRRFILRTSGNDFGHSHFRDAFAQRLVRNMDLDYQAYSPSVVFVNGEYWGIHNIRERLDQHYLHNIYGVDPDNVDMLTGWNTAEEGDAVRYDAFLEFLRVADPTNEDHFKKIGEYIDIENHVDYMIAQIYIANTDWPHNNMDFWRERVAYSPQLPKGKDGRFRWILYDTDFGISLVNDAGHNTLEWVTNPTGIEGWEWPNFVFRHLLNHAGYREMFITRFLDNLNTTFKPGRAGELLAEMKSAIAPEINEHISRWRQPESRAKWEYETVLMSQFVQSRASQVLTHLKDHFDIQDEYDVTLTLKQHGTGHIQINSKEIHDSTPGVSQAPYPWTGKYLSGLPIRIRPHANDGFAFDHWIVDGNKNTEETLTLVLEAHTEIEAVFIESNEKLEVTPIHYWFFDTSIENDSPIFDIPTSYSKTQDPGKLVYFPPVEVPVEPGNTSSIMDRVNDPTPINLQSDLLDQLGITSDAMRGIRVRNPLDVDGKKGHLVLEIPTTGFKSPRFSAAVSRTNNGPLQISFSYSATLDDEWTDIGIHVTEFPLSTNFDLVEVDFEGIEDASDNEFFRVRIDFKGNVTGNSGNVRFNNVVIEASPFANNELITALPEEQRPLAHAVFPNPASAMVNIHLTPTSLDDIDFIVLTDIRGVEIARIAQPKDTMYSLDLTRYSPGLYLINIVGKKRIESHKVIKNH